MSHAVQGRIPIRAMLRNAAWVVLFAGSAIATVSALPGWTREGLTAYWLLVHVVSAPLVLLGLAAVAIVGPPTVARWGWLYPAILVLGLLSTVSIGAVMWPGIGYPEQHAWIDWHGWFSAGLAVCLALSFLSRFRRRGGAR